MYTYVLQHNISVNSFSSLQSFHTSKEMFYTLTLRFPVEFLTSSSTTGLFSVSVPLRNTWPGTQSHQWFTLFLQLVVTNQDMLASKHVNRYGFKNASLKVHLVCSKGYTLCECIAFICWRENSTRLICALVNVLTGVQFSSRLRLEYWTVIVKTTKLQIPLLSPHHSKS